MARWKIISQAQSEIRSKKWQEAECIRPNYINAIKNNLWRNITLWGMLLLQTYINFCLRHFYSKFFINKDSPYDDICPSTVTSELMNFHESWYEDYAIGRHPTFVRFNFLLSKIPTNFWGLHEISATWCRVLKFYVATDVWKIGKFLYNVKNNIATTQTLYLAFCLMVQPNKSLETGI